MVIHTGSLAQKTDWKKVGVVRFEELTKLLAVQEYDSFTGELIRFLDQNDVRVDCGFPRRKSRPPKSGSSQQLYRNEVQRIPVMSREDELRFCMGVELLWRRLKKARKEAGFLTEDINRFPGTATLDLKDCPQGFERLCHGCVPADTSPSVRMRLRLRTHEFHAVRNELLERNLHIVFRLLERYRKAGVPAEDMIQEANYSLFKAIENFDFTRGVRFKTYATYWVNQAFLNAIYNQSRTVRVPAYIQKAMKKISEAANGNEQGLADPEVISKKAGIPVELVESALTGNRFTLSLDRSTDEVDGARMIDLVEDEREDVDPAVDVSMHESADLGMHLDEAMNRLSPREQRVLNMRFGLHGSSPSTLAEVGAALDVSLERVRQIQKGALDKIRHSGKIRQLREFS